MPRLHHVSCISLSQSEILLNQNPGLSPRNRHAVRIIEKSFTSAPEFNSLGVIFAQGKYVNYTHIFIFLLQREKKTYQKSYSYFVFLDI